MGYIAVAQGVKVRAALLTAITRKAIFMAEVSSEQSADIVNFVSSDIRKIYDGHAGASTSSSCLLGL